MKRRKKASKKPKKKEGFFENDAEEQALESALFGASAGVDEKIDERVASADWVVDVLGTTVTEDKPTKVKGPQAAWEDEDDETLEINVQQTRLRKLRKTDQEETLTASEFEQRLRSKHKDVSKIDGEWAVVKPKKKRSKRKRAQAEESSDSEEEEGSRKNDADGTSWANLSDDNDDDDDEEDEDDVLRGTSALSTARPAVLPQGMLHVTRVKDANKAEPSQAVVQSVQFHPRGQLLMTAGLDKTLRFFQVDGVRNSKVQGVHIKDLPIHCASFTQDGSKVIASGRRKHYYIYDVMKGAMHKVPNIQGREERSLENHVISPDGSCVSFFGNNGYIINVDMRSHKPVGTMKMNGSLRGLAYSSDGSQLYSTGGDGEVYIWDARNRRCVKKFMDDGCLHGSAIAVSQNNQYLATGADSGVVNIYNTNSFADTTRPAPDKAIMSLTTPVDHIMFNHDAQMMAIASQRKKDSLRLVHLPSMTTFANWPTGQTPLHYVTSLDFSQNSGFLAIGNARGKVLLYRLNYFLQA